MPRRRPQPLDQPGNPEQARLQFRALSFWWLLPVEPDSPTAELWARVWAEAEILKRLPLTDFERLERLLEFVDDLEPGLRGEAERHLERNAGGR